MMSQLEATYTSALRSLLRAQFSGAYSGRGTLMLYQTYSHTVQ